MGHDQKSHVQEDKIRTLGIIPARAGSKSIPRKNIALLGGRPLVSWCMDAAVKSRLKEVICSTDDDAVMMLAFRMGIRIFKRPNFLAGDDVPVLDVVKYVLRSFKGFDAIALIQPTSPFITDKVINDCLAMLRDNPDLNSVQTISEPPHNFHAWNQRRFKKDKVEFVYKKQRLKAYNKQLKPKHFVFGNLVVTRTTAIEAGLFAEPSGGIVVSRHESLDIDTKEDLDYANYTLTET